MSKIDKVTLYPFSPLKLLHETRKLTAAQSKFFVALMCLYFERYIGLEWGLGEEKEQQAASYAPYCGVTKKTFIKMIDALQDAGVVYINDRGCITPIIAEEIRDAVKQGTHQILECYESDAGVKVEAVKAAVGASAAPVVASTQEEKEGGKVVSAETFCGQEAGATEEDHQADAGDDEPIAYDAAYVEEIKKDIDEWLSPAMYVRCAWLDKRDQREINEVIEYAWAQGKFTEEEIAEYTKYVEKYNKEAIAIDLRARWLSTAAAGCQAKPELTPERASYIKRIDALAVEKAREIGKDNDWFDSEAKFDVPYEERKEKAAPMAQAFYDEKRRYYLEEERMPEYYANGMAAQDTFDMICEGKNAYDFAMIDVKPHWRQIAIEAGEHLDNEDARMMRKGMVWDKDKLKFVKKSTVAA